MLEVRIMVTSGEYQGDMAGTGYEGVLTVAKNVHTS